MSYSYRIGQAVTALQRCHGNAISPVALGNISERPGLWCAYLQHIDLRGIDAPAWPDDWRPGAREAGQFWLGFYHYVDQRT
jgi:hypothetical protein